MPTIYKDQFYTLDPGNPPSAGTPVTFQRYEFTDANDDGLIRPNESDTWDGSIVSSVWENDTVTINVPGVGDVTYTGTTFYLADGRPPVFTPTDGQVLQNGTFVSSTYVTTSTEMPVANTGPTCFVPGTLIDTPMGRKPIEQLVEGDLVTTMDAGPQPIRMILRGTFRAVGDAAPVLFAAGALGNRRPLMVSPQHRMLISGWRAEILYGHEEVLIPAKHLINGTSITQLPGGEVEYIHLLFDDHQVIFGGGIPSESYLPAQVAWQHNPKAKQQMLQSFAAAADADPAPEAKTARPVMRWWEASAMVA